MLDLFSSPLILDISRAAFESEAASIAPAPSGDPEASAERAPSRSAFSPSASLAFCADLGGGTAEGGISIESPFWISRRAYWISSLHLSADA